ncbi:MAG: efflux RND transporter permease subunit, partial [Myxococcales bacterium]|nr:efflux RND transporter permease subunit [Myxococcales bacterium]
MLEQLSVVKEKLPAGVSPALGPDATGVGWVYEYALLTGPYCEAHPGGLWRDPETGRFYAAPADAPDDDARERLVHARIFPRPAYDACPLDGGPLAEPDQDLSDLRGLQDWFLRYELTSVDGVSEVASLGGFVKQYQVVVDPVKLRAYGISLARVKAAVQESNRDVGGRVVEISETEYMVRGIGYLGSLSEDEERAALAGGRRLENARTDKVLADLRQAALGASEDGVPITLEDVADVRVGPEIRRGVADWDGLGEVVGGVVVMRYGENARATIARVKARLAELERGLPPGVAVAAGYDRSDLIERAATTLSHTLMEEMLVVALVCILFLLHARSALVAAFVLPSGVLLSFVLMRLGGINANIMSLGGVAIAIGVMVDSSIIMVENAHKHLELEAARVAGGAEARPRAVVIAEAAREVGPSLFFSLLIITVSFLPVFALGEQSGRLFKPLAYTKTFSMGAAALLAVTVIPVLMVWFIRERVVP